MNKLQIKLILSLTLSIFFLVGFSIQAEGEAKPSGVKKKYEGGNFGSAGCGLGSIIIGPTEGLEQLLAVSTNNIFPGGQSTSITFGIANCDADEVKKKASLYRKREQEVFVQVNYNALETEMVRGQGEKLDALGKLLGCPTDNAFGDFSRKQHSILFQYEEVRPTTFVKQMKAALHSNSKFKKSCKFI